MYAKKRLVLLLCKKAESIFLDDDVQPPFQGNVGRYALSLE
jgi:hypothetical protein